MAKQFLIKNYSGTDFITPSEDYFNYLGGTMIVSIWADDFGTGQVVLEASPDNSTTWIPLDDVTGVVATYAVNKITKLDRIAIGHLLRANYSGGTAVNLNVKVEN